MEDTSEQSCAGQTKMTNFADFVKGAASLYKQV